MLANILGAKMIIDSAISIIAVSILSVAILDIWQRLSHRVGGLPPTDWAIVGRWLRASIEQRKLFNHPLQAMPAYPNELLIGWMLHYLVGFFYVVLYVILWKTFGILSPTWADGLIFGVLSVAVPWFFFMPAVGTGIMGRKTPQPGTACLSVLAVHSVFGVAIGLLLRWI